jgi:hypothetical protein
VNVTQGREWDEVDQLGDYLREQQAPGWLTVVRGGAAISAFFVWRHWRKTGTSVPLPAVLP